MVFLAGVFAFRVAHGLSMPFWSEDERQVYLIGLRSFARDEWPYFGADVVWTGGQVPGALLGWLIRAPLALWSEPEAPIVLLNLLSCGALACLAWYLTRRLPQVPGWLVWGSLFVLPWTLNFSTHVVNPSFVLPGAIVFFIGFFEALPALRRGLLPWTAAWACLGAGLFWVMQIHMSWVLLPPFVAVAAAGLVFGRTELGVARGRATRHAAVGFSAGALATGSLLLPTLVRYGIGAGHVGAAVEWQPQDPLGLVTTAARVLSFASFEANRFLGQSTAERALVLWRHPWLVPFALVVAAAGIVQPVWMAVSAFRPARGAPADWTPVRVLLGATVLLIYASYFFSVRGAQGHAFYVVFPVAALYACTCWQARAASAGGRVPRLERVAAVVIVSAVVLPAGIAIDRWPRQSLYVDRLLVAAAIDAPNDRFLGDRRDTRIEPRDPRPRPFDAVADPAAYLAARAEDDLRVVASAWTPLAGRFSRFSLAVRHRGRDAAWLDLRFATSYLAADGRPLAAREGVIKQILQPGQTRDWTDIADGQVPDGAAAATITVTGAERVIPHSR